MSFRNWWRRKGGRSKTITILATLMILQIGLCFSTPKGVSWYRALFHLKPSDDPLEMLGIMCSEAVLCLVTVVLLVLITIFWNPDVKSPKRNEEEK
jgi:hypothetical protein